MISLQALRKRRRGAGGVAMAALLAGVLAAPDGAVLLAQQPPPPTSTASAPNEGKLSGDQLESLVAPVALYPDPLLAQVLVASTYPLDVIAAQQWLGKNASLKGDELVKAAEKQDWDPSVQALVSLPDALKVLSDNVKWTADLGDAFLAQQSDVMDAVQRLRAKAKDGGKLASSEQQKVETKVVETKTIIVIQPASTQVVYVPTYSPTVIWGPPPYYPYPPIYYPPYYAGAAWVGFGVGIAVGIGMSGGWGWGCGWHGSNNTININNNNNYIKHNNTQYNVNRSGNSDWQHNAQQRGGVPYKDKATASKYGGSARGESAQSRQAQAQNRQGQARPSAGTADRSGSGGSRPGGASAGTMNRGGGASAGNTSQGGSSRAGTRDVAPSSRGGDSSAFGTSSRGGSSFSGNSAQSSSARGASSMSQSGGASRGGGGGGKRR
jgi:hypothetical protein